MQNHSLAAQGTQKIISIYNNFGVAGGAFEPTLSELHAPLALTQIDLYVSDIHGDSFQQWSL